VGKLQEVLDICRQITSSVPTDAEDLEDVIQAVMTSVKDRMMAVVGASDMEICPIEDESEVPSLEGVSYILRGSDGKTMAMWKVTMSGKLEKEDKALLEVMIPYLSWTLENGLAMITLSDEHRRLSKEHYVHGMHLEENKRQNIVKKACLFLVAGITPYIDRVVNEVHKLTSFNYLADPEIKVAKYRYLDELLACINDYNEIQSIILSFFDMFKEVCAFTVFKRIVAFFGELFPVYKTTIIFLKAACHYIGKEFCAATVNV
jgi:hypothetical protein